MSESKHAPIFQHGGAPQLFMNDAELIPPSVSCGLASRSSEKQKNEDSVKSNQSAGQEQDEYCGSTDEEPGDVRETAASTSLPPGQISIVEQLSAVSTGETRFTQIGHPKL